MTPPPRDEGLGPDDFDFDLPEDRIAQTPSVRRDDARLMLLDRSGEVSPADAFVRDLPDRLRGDELVVVNDSKVVPARLRGTKPSGGRVELLVLGPAAGAPGRVRALGRSSKPFRPGMPIEVAPSVALTVEAVDRSRGEGELTLRLPDGHETPWALLETWGEVPLPPYIRRAGGPTPEDRERYQTVYANEPGSVAAPTAGLHLGAGVLAALDARGIPVERVTLHVGPGTFLPIRSERLEDHALHAERYEVPESTARALAGARREGRPVLAVGTTVVRTLESAALADGTVAPGAGETRLFVRPGFRFQVVEQLLTNFHLPRSSLLVLVSAFAGRRRVLDAYAEAVRRGYRFYSYGDAMLLR